MSLLLIYNDPIASVTTDSILPEETGIGVRGGYEEQVG